MYESEQEIYLGLRDLCPKNDEVEFDLSELIDINTKKNTIKNYSAILLSKLISLNIIFYSQLSLCNRELKLYLQKIFDFDNIINNYLIDSNIDNSVFGESTLSRKNSIINCNITNDVKCSLTQLLNYLKTQQKNNQQ